MAKAPSKLLCPRNGQESRVLPNFDPIIAANESPMPTVAIPAKCFSSSTLFCSKLIGDKKMGRKMPAINKITQITYNMTYGKGARLYTFPDWSTAFGWMLSVIPLFFLPGFVFYNLRKFKQKGQVSFYPMNKMPNLTFSGLERTVPTPTKMAFF